MQQIWWSINDWQYELDNILLCKAIVHALSPLLWWAQSAYKINLFLVFQKVYIYDASKYIKLAIHGTKRSDNFRIKIWSPQRLHIFVLKLSDLCFRLLIQSLFLHSNGMCLNFSFYQTIHISLNNGVGSLDCNLKRQLTRSESTLWLDQWVLGLLCVHVCLFWKRNIHKKNSKMISMIKNDKNTPYMQRSSDNVWIGWCDVCPSTQRHYCEIVLKTCIAPSYCHLKRNILSPLQALRKYLFAR